MTFLGGAAGSRYADLSGGTTDMVDKILRRTNSTDIPVEQAAKFNLVVNRTTEKALRPTIP